MARMARRERGVYAFLQKPSEMRLMPAKFRLLMEQGRVAEAMQPVNDALELLGYGNYMPDYRIFYADLSPQASHRMDEKERCCRRHPWLGEYIENFTSTRLLRKAERVAEHFGMEYIKEKFCPVCWGRPQCVSEKEMVDKIGYIASQSGSELRPSIQLYNIAVTDESYRLYHMSMPVVWMRYSYLRRFRSGQDIINVYRMMKGSEKVYDIPLFPYQGVPDFMI